MNQALPFPFPKMSISQCLECGYIPECFDAKNMTNVNASTVLENADT
jgi:hypothetical protein